MWVAAVPLICALSAVVVEFTVSHTTVASGGDMRDRPTMYGPSYDKEAEEASGNEEDVQTLKKDKRGECVKGIPCPNNCEEGVPSLCKSCSDHSECDGAFKCCKTLCGFKCIFPLFKTPCNSIQHCPEGTSCCLSGSCDSHCNSTVTIEDQESGTDALGSQREDRNNAQPSPNDNNLTWIPSNDIQLTAQSSIDAQLPMQGINFWKTTGENNYDPNSDRKDTYSSVESSKDLHITKQNHSAPQDNMENSSTAEQNGYTHSTPMGDSVDFSHREKNSNSTKPTADSVIVYQLKLQNSNNTSPKKQNNVDNNPSAK